jgi:hypothetical protein
MNEELKERFAKARKSIVRRIANRLAVTLGLPLLVLAAVAAGLHVFNFDFTARTTVWLFVAVVTAFITLLMTGQVMISDVRGLRKDMHAEYRASSDKTKKEIEEIVAKGIDPRVMVLRGKREVRSAAAQAIEEECANGKNPEVAFFGSASLKPSEQEIRDAAHKAEDHELSDALRYDTAVNELKNPDSKVRVSRFIRLLDDVAFTSREGKTRAAYLAWLEYQVAYLKANANYTLYDTRRAPEWGGPRSSIITRTAMLDIIGDGRAGVLLVSARIPGMVFDESKKHFWAAGLDANKPHPYSCETASLLETKLKALKALHEKLAHEATKCTVRKIKEMAGQKSRDPVL